jgi:hypothetical protein
MQKLRQRSNELLETLDNEWIQLSDDHTLECCVCYEDFNNSNLFQFTGCKHMCCKNCATLHIQTMFNDFNTHTITCIQLSCTMPVSTFDLSRVLTTDQIEKFERRSLSIFLSRDKNFFQCPGIDCRNGVHISDNETFAVSHFDCNLCKVSYCTKCLELWHEGITCEELVKSTNSNDDMQELREMMNKGVIQPCPYCGAPVMKSSGCDTIKCGACLQDFIWNVDQTTLGKKLWEKDTSYSCLEYRRILLILLFLLVPLTIWLHHLWYRSFDIFGSFATFSCMLHIIAEIQMRGSPKTFLSTHGKVNVFVYGMFWCIDGLISVIISLSDWFLNWFEISFLTYIAAWISTIISFLDIWIRRPCHFALILVLSVVHLAPHIRGKWRKFIGSCCGGNSGKKEKSKLS